MLIPKENTKKIYTYVLTEGVIVVKKDTLGKHHDLAIPNLQVMLTMKSMKSRGLVDEQFAWHHHYYVLKDEGIMWLRNYLHLPESVVPATMVKGRGGAAAAASTGASGTAVQA